MYRVDSPGRVNLMGEHTDYALGYVMPMAINLYTVVHAQMSNSVRVYSQIFHDVHEFPVESPAKSGDWSDHVKAVFWVLKNEGHKVGGVKAIVGGDLPVGSGLGSSASLKVAFISLLNRIYELNLLPVEIALLAKKAENEYMKVPTGVSDPFTVVNGRKGHVLFIDTDALNHSYIKFPESARLIAFYTGITREVASSSYAERRKLAEETLRILGRHSSIDVSERDLRTLPSLYRRFFGYIVRENRRVLEARDALRSSDLEKLGELMTTSHCDVARNYDVSSEELDFIVKRAVELGAYGAKMTGAGFGGSAIILTDEERAIDVAEALMEDYMRTFNWEPEYHIVIPSDGVKARIV
ncbi:galactokinase [Thermococcus sp.]